MPLPSSNNVTNARSNKINNNNNNNINSNNNTRAIGRDSITSMNAMSVVKLSETNAINSSNNRNVTAPMENYSDSEEDFDRTTRKLGAPQKWIFNYQDVSVFFFI